MWRDYCAARRKSRLLRPRTAFIVEQAVKLLFILQIIQTNPTIATFFFRFIKKLHFKNVIAFFGGIPAQLLLRAAGYSLGKNNDKFLENRGVDVAKELLKVMKEGADCYLPIDFTVKIGETGHTIRTLSIADTEKY